MRFFIICITTAYHWCRQRLLNHASRSQVPPLNAAPDPREPPPPTLEALPQPTSSNDQPATESRGLTVRDLNRRVIAGSLKHLKPRRPARKHPKKLLVRTYNRKND